MSVFSRNPEVDTCKKLKTLGWDTYTYTKCIENNPTSYSFTCLPTPPGKEAYPAPDAFEFGEVLPHRIGKYQLTIIKEMSFWMAGYRDETTGEWLIDYDNRSIAQAMAELWFYVKENKLIVR